MAKRKTKEPDRIFVLVNADRLEGYFNTPEEALSVADKNEWVDACLLEVVSVQGFVYPEEPSIELMSMSLLDIMDA